MGNDLGELAHRAVFRLVTLACLQASLFAVPVARANDSVMGGTATDLVPIVQNEVRMMSEDIQIREDGKHWEVSADYVFRNQSKEDVQLQVGFPEHRCGAPPGEDDEGVDCITERPLDFESMRTTVQGVEVRHTQGTLDPSHDWAPRLGTVWLYRASFPAGKDVRVTHRYRVLKGYDSMGGQLGFYVTRTGATWKGSIGHARFVVQVPANAFELYLPREVPGLRVSSRLVDVAGKPRGELVFEARNWNPTEDLFWGYVSHLPPYIDLPDYGGAPARAGLAADQRCFHLNELWESGYGLADGNKEPDAALIASYVQKDIGSARICRNFLFAARGRRFDDLQLNRYFYGEKGWVPGKFPFAPFTPSPVYDDALLTAGDWATVRLIDAIEKARTAPALPVAAPGATASTSTETVPPPAPGPPPASAAGPAAAPANGTPEVPAPAARSQPESGGCGVRRGASGAGVSAPLAALALGIASRLRRRRVR